MKRNVRRWSGVMLALLGATAGAEEAASDIAAKARERGALNLLGLTAELKLVTSHKGGAEKTQVLTSSAKKIGGRVHSLARFSAPAGVAGVAVLSVESAGGGGNDIALYLPKLRRVRKVAKSDRGKAFMDTDFSYSDLGGVDAKDSALSRLPDQTLDGRAVYVLRGKNDDSPYGEVTVFVDAETYVPMKVEYQDKEGKPFKRYRTLKLKQFQDRTLAAEAVMENLQSGSKTQLEILKLETSKLPDEAFTERGLERG